MDWWVWLIVVGLAVASALTLLPALLTIIGPRVDRFAVRMVARTPGTDLAMSAARRLWLGLLTVPRSVTVPAFSETAISAGL